MARHRAAHKTKTPKRPKHKHVAKVKRPKAAKPTPAKVIHGAQGVRRPQANTTVRGS